MNSSTTQNSKPKIQNSRALTAALLLIASAAHAHALPQSKLTVTLSWDEPQIRGAIDTTVTNTSSVPLGEVVLMLFPNRFATPDTGVNDWNRPYVYPGEDFEPGGIAVSNVRADGVVAVTTPLDGIAPPPSYGLRVLLSSPLRPGGQATIHADFATRVPLRFGTFGEFQETLTALGGWYPYVPALDAEGRWQVGAPPPLSDFAVDIAAATRLEVQLNGRWFAAIGAPVHAEVASVHYLTLIAAPEFLREEIEVGGSRIVYYRRPAVRSDRIAPGPTQVEIMRDALAEIVAQRPAAVPAPAGDLVVVEAPLRLDLTAPGEGMAVISDRSLKVLWLVRPFEQAQLAQAVYEELLRPSVAAREPAADYAWVGEGTSYEMARRYYSKAFADNRSVQSWIELFNIFAIVDRFEVAPKIPFVGAFFEKQPTADPLHERISTYTSDLPPGHVVFGKLHQLVGDETFQRVITACAGAQLAWRACAARESGRDLDAFFAQWLQPYPAINYSFSEVELNECQGDQYLDRVTVRRESSRPIVEPVPVQLRSIGGEKIDLRWDGAGDTGELTARAPFRVQQAVIDPDRVLIETTRADGAVPPEPQLILDTAAVEVSSTEFGFSGVAVARGRYDYRKDFAFFGAYTNRGIGFASGPRYHWGEMIDAADYRNNLYAFYTVQALDKSFVDDRNPSVRTSGHINGLGVRYDYDNILSYDNPTHEVQVQLYADWYDRGIGSDYNFADWGGSLVMTHPLWSYRTILAGQIFNGFSEPFGTSVVPNQSLYSLGGSRSIRGIGAEAELARNIFVVRAELRHTLFDEVDLNLLDLLVLRRFQVRPFVDTGQVSNSAGAVYDPSGYAVGVGLGFGAFYDFMGFFPSLVYLEVATRVDTDPGDVQVLFGTRQSF